MPCLRKNKENGEYREEKNDFPNSLKGVQS